MLRIGIRMDDIASFLVGFAIRHSTECSTKICMHQKKRGECASSKSSNEQQTASMTPLLVFTAYKRFNHAYCVPSSQCEQTNCEGLQI